MEIILQILGVVFSAATPLLFAAPRLPYLKKYVRPLFFEEGWYSLVLNRELNYNEEGFNEVLWFIIGHSTEDGNFAEVVADDVGVEEEDITAVSPPAVEEIRIMSKPPDWKEQILLCYDKDTDGPPGESNTTTNHGLEVLNTESSGEDWRWFGPLSAVEYNAQRYSQERINRWTNYGAVTLALGVLFQILAIAL